MGIDNIILIDDDPLNNFLNVEIVKRYFPEINHVVFTNPEVGLEYVLSSLSEKGKKTIILLDVKMPELSGWEFLDLLAPHQKNLKNRYRIYMLTSSIDPMDHALASKNALISGYFEKPLTSINIKALCDFPF
jgi:CheY-like chemotaxis protein